jgi:maltooligosyltrehalose trehalohydrolase
MGEDGSAAQPFPFFCDFESELADAVRNGRRAEFAKFPEFQAPERREQIPDPTAQETFVSAKLRWEDAGRGVHAEWRDWYRRVLMVRHAEIIPRLAGIGSTSGHYEILGDLAVRVRWRLADRAELLLTTNLKTTPLAGIGPPRGRVLWSVGSAENGGLGPWSVVWTLTGGA